MLQKTARYMEKYRMAESGEKIVLGLSGGMDSVCLFHVLLELGYQPEAVHVHHGIRGAEADRDERFCRRLCESYGVSCHVFHFDVPKISRREHLTEEEAGRNVRRQAFFEVMKETGAKHIALAHHGNDRAETMLFHLIRGTGLKGMVSMKPCSGVFIRPLLWAEREEIEDYIRRHHYDYVEDETNASVEYTRNRLRHQVLPLLKEINPAAAAHLCAAAEKLGEVSEHIDSEAETLKRSCVCRKEQEVLIDKESFFSAAGVLRIPVLQSCIHDLSGSLADICQEHYEQMLKLFELQSGRELHLPGGLAAERTYQGIRIFLRRQSETKQPVSVTGPGTYHFGGQTFYVSEEKWDQSKNFPCKTYTKCFDYDKIKGNLFLRTRMAGDYMEINRTGGRKRLQDYFVNEKIPKAERDEIAVLADGNHILWVAGKRISEYYKITEETKRVLKVQMDGGNDYGFYSERVDFAGAGRDED